MPVRTRMKRAIRLSECGGSGWRYSAGSTTSMERNSGWIAKARKSGRRGRENSTIEDMATYLLGSSSRDDYCGLRGVTCLHASAVAFGETSRGIRGLRGRGKINDGGGTGARGHAICPMTWSHWPSITDRSMFIPRIPICACGRSPCESLYGSAEALPNSARTTKSAACHWENRNCSSRNEPCRWLQFISWASVAANPPRWWKNSRRSRRSSLWWPTRLRRTSWMAACAQRNLKPWDAWLPA